MWWTHWNTLKLFTDMNKQVEQIKAEIERLYKEAKEEPYNGRMEGRLEVLDKLDAFIDSLEEEPVDMGEVSDGYHTFNELYHYRMLYNAAFFNALPKYMVHKSKRHHTGEECFGGGWFIVMANLPTGQISNHYELKDWKLFNIPEQEFADEWDGHTPKQAAERLQKFLETEEPVSEDLEQAAVEAFKHIVDSDKNNFYEIFKAGANWQKEQMLKDAVNGEVGYWNITGLSINMKLPKCIEDGDKVKVIIVKEE